MGASVDPLRTSTGDDLTCQRLVNELPQLPRPGQPFPVKNHGIFASDDQFRDVMRKLDQYLFNGAVWRHLDNVFDARWMLHASWDDSTNIGHVSYRTERGDPHRIHVTIQTKAIELLQSRVFPIRNRRFGGFFLRFRA